MLGPALVSSQSSTNGAAGVAARGRPADDGCTWDDRRARCGRWYCLQRSSSAEQMEPFSGRRFSLNRTGQLRRFPLEQGRVLLLGFFLLAHVPCRLHFAAVL
ncbi:hypothetical protein MRX96_036145 [Rhipicephalus microplus]